MVDMKTMSHCSVMYSAIVMRGLRQARVAGLLGALVFLTACAPDNKFAEIQAFMKEVEGQPVGRIEPLPEFEAYEPFTYGATNKRSPFEPPIILPPKSEQQRRNVGLKPPENHVKQFLERFNIAALSMVGSLEQDGNSWALVKDGEGGVHRVQVGDFMGSNWGQIESINDSRIDLTEIVSDGAGGWLKRPRSIELTSID